MHLQYLHITKATEIISNLISLVWLLFYWAKCCANKRVWLNGCYFYTFPLFPFRLCLLFLHTHTQLTSFSIPVSLFHEQASERARAHVCVPISPFLCLCFSFSLPVNFAAMASAPKHSFHESSNNNFSSVWKWSELKWTVSKADDRKKWQQQHTGKKSGKLKTKNFRYKLYSSFWWLVWAPCILCYIVNVKRSRSVWWCVLRMLYAVVYVVFVVGCSSLLFSVSRLSFLHADAHRSIHYTTPFTHFERWY